LDLYLWNLNNYKIPESVENFDAKTFHDTFKENIKMYNHFKKQGVLEEDLVYFYLSGTMVNVLTTMNGRILEWISGLRCCRKAQWEIRAIFNSIVKDAKKIAPLYGKGLGPSCQVKGVCKEGKDSCQRTASKRS
jgi:thymidylate synthase (FAD)